MDKYFKAVSVEDELPKEGVKRGLSEIEAIGLNRDSSITNMTLDVKSKKFYDACGNISYPTHWLKETTIEELVEQKSCEFAEWIDANELTQSLSGNWRYNRSKVVADTTTELFKKFTIENGGKK